MDVCVSSISTSARNPSPPCRPTCSQWAGRASSSWQTDIKIEDPTQFSTSPRGRFLCHLEHIFWRYAGFEVKDKGGKVLAVTTFYIPCGFASHSDSSRCCRLPSFPAAGSFSAAHIYPQVCVRANDVLLHVLCEVKSMVFRRRTPRKKEGGEGVLPDPPPAHLSG